MRTVRISKGGQVTVPAALRRRWGTSVLLLEDRGDVLLLRPMPEDPIGAASGSLAGPGPNADEARALLREEEAAEQRRKWGGR